MESRLNYTSDYLKSSVYGRSSFETWGIAEIETFARSFRIRPGIDVSMVNLPFALDKKIRYRVRNAPITFSFQLSGETLSHLKGKGQPGTLHIKPGTCSISHIQETRGDYRILPRHPFLFLSIDIDPGLLMACMENEKGYVDPEVERVALGSEGSNFYINRHLTTEMYRAAHNLVACAMATPERRLYLESKTLEMMALQIDLFYRSGPNPDPDGTNEKELIYRAREILVSDLENPPSISHLAALAGTNEFKLKKGFKQFFHQTIYGCLRSERMKKARCLILENGINVTSAALLVGYSNVSHFIAAYKKEFGITPGQQIKADSKTLARPAEPPF